MIERDVRLGERLVERRVARHHLLRRKSRREAVPRIKVPDDGKVATCFEDLESCSVDGTERLRKGLLVALCDGLEERTGRKKRGLTPMIFMRAVST